MSLLSLMLVACSADDVAPDRPADTGTPEDSGVDPFTPSWPDDPVGTLRVTASTDVVIVGAGVAGLAAAIDAQAAGANVVVLEREATAGGAATWAGGMMLFSGTPMQAEQGIVDSAEQLLAEWPDFTGGDTTDPWVRFFAENNVPLVYDWLAAFGVTWVGINEDSSAGTTTRIHSLSAGGASLVDHLLDQVPASAFHYEAEATGLVVEGGRVVGVTWTNLADGSSNVVRARTVIVATGGFMHDLERVREVKPELADLELSWGSWPGDDGNGLAMLEQIGAATQNLGAIGLYAHGVRGFEDDNELRVDHIDWTPWVNAEGRRFCDEFDKNNFKVGATRAAQPNGDAWMIFDDATAASMSFAVNTPTGAAYTLDQLADGGILSTGDDLLGLAAALGVDGDALVDEIGAFNDFAEGVTDVDDFRVERAGTAPVLTAPFHALPVAITVAKGFGGIDVDLQGRVLDEAGAVIPGLYAAGELTGMAGGSLVGEYGFTGSLSAVTLGGRVAGQNAAAEALAD